MSITLDQLTKRYQGLPVVNDVSLSVAEGEFFVLLGPSGSGKSTLLRAIAGLTGIDHGRIALHGRDVTYLPARQREVGFVFQNYALFGHMTVAENIEFALRVRKVKAADRRARQRELLRMVALEGMGDRLPSQLSGGQQQRVAVARALAHRPNVLLLDEPFGALDARIREDLRGTIREVQRELGISAILVTHDQEEAFALADRIGVMNQGRLLDSGTPDELYSRPASRFVATFLGAANLLLACRTADGIDFNAAADDRREGPRDPEVVVVVRPQDIELAGARDRLDSQYIGQGSVESIVYTGASEKLRIRPLRDSALARISSSGSAEKKGMLEVTRSQHEQSENPFATGQTVAIGVRHVHMLPTPLTSFIVCAASAPDAEALERHPLLEDLVAKMQTRVTVNLDAALPGNPPRPGSAATGVAVISAGADAPARIARLFRDGATEVLVLPVFRQAPKRVLIHWTDDAARRSTLAVAASLLRHVPAEALSLNVLPAGSAERERHQGMFGLLDARSEGQAIHRFDVRTELRVGDAAEELARELASLAGEMLILGVSDPAEVERRFDGLLGGTLTHPAIVVCASGREHPRFAHVR
ncbi:MAG TPA: ABC transporter ATP-binding protein [Steroidobacteraceae bacterium]|nr:ABC transporter ATP-binding protein [Steroidobacteraceae bacterium]